jgi:hypothetical protein
MFLLSFRSHFLQQAEREKERIFIYLLRAATFIIIREGGIRDGEIGNGEIEEGGCEIVETYHNKHERSQCHLQLLY